MDAPLTAVFCADLEPAHALPRVKAEAVARGKDARQVEDLELAVGYYATHGKLASLVKGVAANALSPVAPAPQPEGRQEGLAYKSAMLAAQTPLAATAHGKPRRRPWRASTPRGSARIGDVPARRAAARRRDGLRAARGAGAAAVAAVGRDPPVLRGPSGARPASRLYCV